MRISFEHEQRLRKADFVTHEVSEDLIRLMLKLRWIGMEKEAELLERTIRTIPANARASVLSSPTSTD